MDWKYDDEGVGRLSAKRLTSARLAQSPAPGPGGAPRLRLLLGVARCCWFLILLGIIATLSACSGGGGQIVNSSGGGGGSVTTVPPPTLSIAINPTQVSVVTGATVNFTVQVSNATNSAVTYSVNNIPSGNSTVGTIGSGSLLGGGAGTPRAAYVAPAAPPVPNTVMVTVTSVQDPTKSASALVVITTAPSAVTVSVIPSSVSVAPGAMIPFTAAVNGAPNNNTTVTWAVNGISGGNSVVGTISPLGMYTAPLSAPSPSSVDITATSLADPTAMGKSAVNINKNVTVSVAPTVANAVTGAQVNFAATVTGSSNTAVQWSVAGVVGGNPTVGTIGISNGVYTAPAAVPTPATVAVTATSLANPTASASAQLMITAPTQVGVSVAPAMTMVAINATQQFMATVTGTANNTVTWSVNGGPANGTITSGGLYTAPGAVPFPNTVTITATSNAANVAGMATVQLSGPSSVNVSVSPAATTIQTGSTQQFTASVTGTTTTTVNWSVNGVPGGNSAVGTISALGLYTAPSAVPSPATVMVTATSTASPSSSGTAALTLIPPPAPVVVTVAPTAGSLKVTNQFQFTVSVSGAPTGQTGVNWSVNNVPGGNATFGTITPGGLYTAPASVPSPAVVNVTATSQFQSSASATAMITILPQDTISITPTMASVQVGLGAQFFVTITGLSNTAATYKINGVVGGNSTVGTISGTGLYVAPATGPTPATVTLTATSVADPTLIATAMITIAPAVTVMVNPATASVALSGAQAFMATVTGTTNSGVNWSVNGVMGGNATVGTIDVNGNYKAPASLLLTSTFTVTATSVVNPAAQGNAQVTVNVPVGVTVAPNAARVATGGMLTFSATVTGNTNTTVTWTVGGQVNPGTINMNTGVYTAPAAPPAGPVTITATSQANPAATGTAQVTVLPPVSVTLAPNPVSVNTGTTQVFMPVVMNAANNSVTWTVNGAPNGNASVGTVNPITNTYTAPLAIPTPATVTVTATSVADPTKSASASVTITPVVTAISVSPATPSIATNATQQFAAMVTGTGNLGVTWQVNGTTGGNINTVGSISASGLYTAPNFTVVTSATMFTITAVSVQNPGVSGSATVTVTPPPITVMVSPDPVTVTVNGTQQFIAMVANAANPAVNWTVNGQFPGNIATIGTIDVNGLYTAPASPPASQPLTIKATSVQGGPTINDTAMVTVVLAEAVTVGPAKTNVTVGTTQAFTATVTGCPSTCTPITWSVVGGAPNGTINSSGVYTAPATVPSPAVVTIMATDSLHPTVSGTTTTTVIPAVAVSVTPNPLSLNAGGAAQTFVATVTGTTNMTVTWSVNGVAGGNNTVGMILSNGQYTPPLAVPNPATVQVTAVSQADPTKSGSAAVTIQGVIVVSVSPATAGVNVTTSQQFSATVANATNLNVTWSVSGTGTIGSISTTGLYTAPAAVPIPATVTVTAASVQDPTKMGTATITVQPVISVAIAPTAMTVTPNQMTQFTATVTGSTNTAVSWAVNGIALGNSTVGTVSSTGLYIAPGTVPTSPVVSVTATSVADPTKAASAAVTISAPGAGIFVTVFPRNRDLPMGRTQRFESHVFLTTNNVVNWFVNNVQNGNSTFGTIDPVTSIYTPPTMLPANPNITVTAVSQADPTKSDTQNETIVVPVVVSPASDSLHVGDNVQFSASVMGVTNTAVTWAVNGIPGGNSTFGMITNGGLYTAPATVPDPDIIGITATSVADPTVPGVASMQIYPARLLTLFPKTASVLPGAKFILQYYTNIYFPPPMSSFGQILSWSVNGVQGGNATVGTISQAGLYTAPLTPQTVTVSAQSLINPAFTASATVTVTLAAGSSSVTLLDPLTKIRPYDVVSGSSAISLAAAQQEYADWQVLVTGNGEDLSNVDVSLSNFTDGTGNTIPASSGTIYFERSINVFYSSRLQGSDLGEWPDPLVPKVDPFVHQVRNAFPFGVNRISRAYKKYPISGGDTTNTGLGAGTATSGGTFTGSVYERFEIVIDTAGALGTATFKWSKDGGVTFQQTGVTTSTSAVTLADGVSVSFQAGGVSGVADFNLGDTFWIFAGPLRNQGVWVDLYVPMGTPAGNYTGTVTVTSSGKPTTMLTVNLQVYAFAIPVSSSIPNTFGGYWVAYTNSHFNVPFGSQTTALGQIYGTACLINRLSCGGNSTYPLVIFNANGTVATSDFSGYDQAIGPLMDGTITPHGEQWTNNLLPFLGANDSQKYFATQVELAHFVTKGWRSRLFDYTWDEPGSSSDFQSLMQRASLVRSVDMSLRALVTQSISQNSYNSLGYVNRFVPNFQGLALKDYQRGPAPYFRPVYDVLPQPGDDMWWYDSCNTTGCGNGTLVPFLDNYPNQMVDTPALNNRAWGIMTLVPYRATGYLYYDVNLAFLLSYNMTLPRVDVWDSIYYFGGNGDGTYFYPGRPANIGGITNIPIESLRIKQVRDAFVDMEYGLKLQAQGDGAFLDGNVLASVSNLYTFNPDPANWLNLRKILGQRIK